MNSSSRPLLITALLATLVFVVGCGRPEPQIDLNAVLDTTSESLQRYSRLTGEQPNPDDDEVFIELANQLTNDYNSQVPPLHEEAVVVAPRADASLIAVADENGDGVAEQGEDALWLIEVDGENARILATSRTGEVEERGFSGTGLLAGYLIGSMLSRQRAAGVNPQTLASKQRVNATQARQAARSRAGSGSYARGK